MNEKNICCPVCNSESKELYEISSTKVIKELEKYYSKNIIENNISLVSYKMQKCLNCTLEFSNPMKTGSKEFYDWITLQNPYYVNTRWEYKKLNEIILSTNDNQELDIIDIGCGNGDFLSSLTQSVKINKVGIDFTQKSIDYCRKNNLNAFCLDIEGYMNLYPKSKFDYVTAFHVLEHLENPVSFLIECKKLIKNNGSMFFSTPYSPSSFEYECFDILNHPPHHMTRWNIKSYYELAKKVNMKIEIYMPDSPNSLIRAIRSTYFKYYGSNTTSFKKSTLKVLLKHFNSFFNNYIQQINREKINNKTSADVILVKFSI